MAQPVQPVQVVEPPTDASRAGMTQPQWDALTDEQRAERRSAFAPITAGAPVRATERVAVTLSPLTDSERAGKTQAQWAALSENERNELRNLYPDPNPHLAVASVPSPPDPHNIARLGGNHPAISVHVEQQINPDERLTYLPNTPGGRNNSTLANFDPTNKETA